MGFQLPNQLYAGPKLLSDDWVRPTDWPVITNVSKEVNFLINDTLSLNIAIRTAFTRTAAENLYIDWGDGSGITTVTNNALIYTNHTYIKGAGTPCSLGYTTFVIRVWTDSTASMSDCKISIADTFNTRFTNIPVSEAYYGDNLSIAFASYFSSAIINAGTITLGVFNEWNYGILEYVKLPSVFGSTMTNLNNTFQYCAQLRKVDLPKSISGIGQSLTFTNTFDGCTKLSGMVMPYVDYLGKSQFLSAINAFNNCTNIRYVYQYDANGLVKEDLVGFYSFGGSFVGCPSLVTIGIDITLIRSDAPYGGSLSSLFSSCLSLQRANIIGWFRQSINIGGQAMNNCFLGCAALETVTFSNNASEGLLGGAPVNTLNYTSMFSGCSSLKGIVTFPRGIHSSSSATTNLSSMFQSCFNLLGVNFEQVATGGTVNMSTMFGSCPNLVGDFIFLPAPTAVVSMGAMFSNCYSLTKFDFNKSGVTGAFILVDSTNTMFQNCYALLEVNLPPTMANCTTVNSMFSGCSVLRSIIFPSNMPLLTNIQGVFTKCYSLEVGILPTTMGNSSLSSIYNQCFSLTIAALPTVAVGAVTGAFADARKVRYIDISNTPTTNNSLSATFQGCSTVETIVLPATMRSCVSGGTAFRNCSNLKEIVNFSGWGSTTANSDFSNNTNMSLLPGLTFSCRLSKVDVSGYGSNEKSALSYLRFQNTATLQWTGSTPQVNISYTNMSTAALVNTFTDIAATGTYTAKTINITGCTGAGGLTAANRLIITSKGWTITG